MGEKLTPRLLYRVSTDGKRELVRGAIFDDLDQRALRSDVVAAGKQLWVANYLGEIPETVLAPALLIDDVTIRRANKEERQAALLSAAGVTSLASVKPRKVSVALGGPQVPGDKLGLLAIVALRTDANPVTVLAGELDHFGVRGTCAGAVP